MVGRGKKRRTRRGAAAVYVVVCLPLMVGVAALAIDVGMVYNARAELQRTADAAALAAAAELGDYSEGDPLVNARSKAAELALLNPVTGSGVAIDESDVVFGRAYVGTGTGKYVFEESAYYPNAVRVQVRRTSGSPSGPVETCMARLFGVDSVDVSAQATAVVIPRDIVFVLDLSTSHNDDSSLRSYKNVEIGNCEMWRSLWDTRHGDPPIDAETGLDRGPALGNMAEWGNAITGPGWDYASDSGLVRLRKGSSWSLTSDFVSYTLNAQGYGSFISTELSAINSSSYDSDTTYYRRRVLVALGIYRWKSGKSGGQSGGNGDNYISSGEVEELVPYPSSSINSATGHEQVGGSWSEFVDYCRSSSSSMCIYNPDRQYYGDSGLQYRFGLKTWVDYLQEKEYGQTNSPGLANTRQQPWGAVVDAVHHCVSVIESLDSSDLIGLASYATYGYGPSNKPNEMAWLTDDLSGVGALVDNLQPGMWTTNTNIAAGIDQGVNVLLNSEDGRSNAAKIMLLLTDGIANTVRDGSSWNVDQAKADAKTAAGDAADQGIRIYTVSVGANADQELMADIAAIGHGEHFYAAGTIEDYSAQLEEIFKKLGGKRPIVLIE